MYVLDWMGYDMKYKGHLDHFIYSSYTIMIISGTAIGIKLVKIWYIQNMEKAELEKKQAEAELNLLKSQVNPHFLYNTLNNINSLVFIDQQQTYEAIVKLGELTRYMIDQADTRFVTLQDEINYLKNYISLQQIRFRNNDFIEFKISGASKGKMIAPMLFIPFVENCFKHGSKGEDLSPGISVNIAIYESSLKFSCSNFINQKPEENGNHSTGIENVKKRLDILYKDKYSLDIEKTKEQYIVKLFIKFG